MQEANHSDKIMEGARVRGDVYLDALKNILKTPSRPIVVRMDTSLFKRYRLPRLQEIGFPGQATMMIRGLRSGWWREEHDTYSTDVYVDDKHIRLVYLDIYEVITLLCQGDIVNTRDWKKERFIA